MAALSNAQAQALRMIVDAVLDTIKQSPDGAPAGHLYAALMAQGCSLNQFESLMGALTRKGMIRKSGDVYHAT